MFWQEENDSKQEYRVPDDVFDLLFRLRGKSLDIDHAHALSLALRQQLDADTCARIGVHGVRLAESGNGWSRPEQADAELPLSRRSRLVIRVHRDDSDAVRQISHRELKLGRQAVEVGDCSVRLLSSMGTVYARAICCEQEQSEADFLQQVANELKTMGIEVTKMICGKTGQVRTGDETLFTRALMVADLKPEQSVRLQQQGIGNQHMLGCGLFVPHKGIDAVYEMPE